MSDLIGEFEQIIQDRTLLQPNQFLLVAVSGGLDSMVLLHLFHRAADKYGWMPVVAHFNHQLRGSASERDQSFVGKVAARLGLKFVTERGDVRKFARKHKISIEMAARQQRHDFLARTCVALGIETVALGHHADDQTELFFLRLFRGAGGEGLAGMRWISPSPSNAHVRLIRPFLKTPKVVLREFAKRERIAFREDATNAQVDFERNRIRRELMPLLRTKYQAALVKTTERTMEIVGAEADYVRQAARAWQASEVSMPFDQLHMAIQRQLLHLELLKLGVAPEFDLIERLRCHPKQVFTVNPGLRICRDRNGNLQTQRIGPEDFKTDQCTLEISSAKGGIAFGGLEIAWMRSRLRTGAPARFRAMPGTEYFDAAKVGTLITLRHWQPGDRFQPIGMERAVKVQDLFTNRKVSREQRRLSVVATTSAGELFWVEGLRMSARFKLDNDTTSRLKWSWRRVEVRGP